MQPLVQKWTGITDKSGKIHTAKIGNYLYFYFLQIMKVRHTLCITNKQRLTEDPIQCGCVRGFFIACVCLLVIIFPKQIDPDQARQNTEF